MNAVEIIATVVLAFVLTAIAYKLGFAAPPPSGT